MKKKIALLMSVIAILAIVIPGSLAYFTDEVEVHNVITSNSVDIQVLEYQQEGNDLVAYPDEEIAIMPGAKVSKIPMVKSLEAESYIRAKYDIVIKDKDGMPMDLTPETLASIISIEGIEDGWVRKDGDTIWWYYEDAVGNDDSTTALFREVIFSGPNMTNEYQNCTVEITVIAQAVQEANMGVSSAVEVDPAIWLECND